MLIYKSGIAISLSAESDIKGMTHYCLMVSLNLFVSTSTCVCVSQRAKKFKCPIKIRYVYISCNSKNDISGQLKLQLQTFTCISLSLCLLTKISSPYIKWIKKQLRQHVSWFVLKDMNMNHAILTIRMISSVFIW